MKGCARTCILWVFIWAAAAGALYIYLREFGVLEPQLYWACGVGGLLMTMAFGYAFTIATAHRERRMLLDAISGVPPEDGKWVAVSGVIRALNPLRSPLSGTHACAYTYKILEKRRSSKGANIVTVFEGKAITPSTIATRHGSVRLLAVPAFDMPMESVPHAAAVERAQEYVRTTTFKKAGKLAEESNDDDGNFRLDKELYGLGSSVDWNECTFEEQLVKQGDTICAFGQYSKDRMALVPHTNWANQCRIMRGDAEGVAAKLRSRMRKYAIGVLITGALAYGIVRLYQYAV